MSACAIRQMKLSNRPSLPGSLVGAYLETRMGKKEAMALSTFATAIGILLFAFVSSRAGTMLVSIWISFQGTLMYAIICASVFPGSIRSRLNWNLDRRLHSAPLSGGISRQRDWHRVSPVQACRHERSHYHGHYSCNIQIAAALPGSGSVLGQRRLHGGLARAESVTTYMRAVVQRR